MYRLAARNFRTPVRPRGTKEQDVPFLRGQPSSQSSSFDSRQLRFRKDNKFGRSRVSRTRNYDRGLPLHPEACFVSLKPEAISFAELNAPQNQLNVSVRCENTTRRNCCWNEVGRSTCRGAATCGCLMRAPLSFASEARFQCTLTRDRLFAQDAKKTLLTHPAMAMF